MKPLQQSITMPKGDTPENESVQAHRRRQKNWLPVIGSLLSILQRHGFGLVRVHDGGDESIKLDGTPRQRRQEAKLSICAVDESEIMLSHPSREKLLWVRIVLGNAPEETVNDYTVHDGLEAALLEFEEKWKGRECPTK